MGHICHTYLTISEYGSYHLKLIIGYLQADKRYLSSHDISDTLIGYPAFIVMGTIVGVS